MEMNIEKHDDVKIWPLLEAKQKSTRVMSSNIFDEGYLMRLRAGDEETAKHFNDYFRRMLRIKLWAKYGHTVKNDLMDDVMAAALEKILNGEPRDPSCLAAYVRGICANLAKRPTLISNTGEINFEQISDRSRSAEEELISRERAHTVRSVLTSLKPRDRLILVDLFYNDLHRDQVCLKYKVNREQLRLILFRARARFQKRWPPK
jgi:RNA polymerase sigma factor (sigma-70 family)